MKYLGLDRASQEALQILADLGKQDGDLENEQPFVKARGGVDLFRDANPRDLALEIWLPTVLLSVSG